MTEAEIARDREIIASAKPGPWRWRREENELHDVIVIETGYGADDVCGIHHAYRDEAAQDDANATLIAEARTRWPAALNEIERLHRLRANPVVWTDAATPFDAQQVCDLLAENARLQRDLDAALQVCAEHNLTLPGMLLPMKLEVRVAELEADNALLRKQILETEGEEP